MPKQGSPDPRSVAPIRAKTILVVEDEPHVRALVVDFLGMDGHKVDTAANGAIALDMLAWHSYGLIISNIHMPELDGPGLYRELERRWPELARTYIFMTGDDGAATSEFLATVPAPVLRKPFTLDDLRQAITMVLGEPRVDGHQGAAVGNVSPRSGRPETG